MLTIIDHIGLKMVTILSELNNEKLPTVKQVEQIMADWGRFTIDEFATKILLETESCRSHHCPHPAVEAGQWR